MRSKISIIVPVYKVERYLCRCIESLIRQDYQDIEIILVDDGSPDNCGNICDEYAQKDTRILVIHQNNGGLSAARNTGLDLATGDYIMCVDSDDWVEPNYCSFALQKAKETNSDIVVFGYMDEFDDHRVPQDIPKEEEKQYSTEDALVELHNGRILSFAWNKIYKASLFEGIRYPVGRLFEDIGTTYKLFHKANTIYLASGITYHYQKRSDSILGAKLNAKGAIDWYDQIQERLYFMSQYYPQLIPQLWKYYGSNAFMCYSALLGLNTHQKEESEMKMFLLHHQKEIQAAGKTNKNLALFYFSPILYKIKSRVMHYLKKVIPHL